MRKHFYFIKEAIRCALKSSMFHRHGSVVVKRNKIIGSGYNCLLRKPTHDLYSKHAEISAIENAKRNGHAFKGARLYVVRLMRDSNQELLRLRNSLPCTKCSFYIESHNISRIFYTCEETTSYDFTKSVSRK